MYSCTDSWWIHSLQRGSSPEHRKSNAGINMSECSVPDIFRDTCGHRWSFLIVFFDILLPWFQMPPAKASFKQMPRSTPATAVDHCWTVKVGCAQSNVAISKRYVQMAQNWDTGGPTHLVTLWYFMLFWTFWHEWKYQILESITLSHDPFTSKNIGSCQCEATKPGHARSVAVGHGVHGCRICRKISILHNIDHFA